MGLIWSDYGGLHPQNRRSSKSFFAFGLWVWYGLIMVVCWLRLLWVVLVVVGGTGKEKGNGSNRVRVRRSLLICGYGGFWLRNLWVWWEGHAFWCLVKENARASWKSFGEREGRATGLSFRKVLYWVWVLKKFYYYYFLNNFFNIMLMWKIVGVSKVSVIYIYIEIRMKTWFSAEHSMNKWDLDTIRSGDDANLIRRL